MASEKQAEFSPAELDRIEDALESLESGELPSDVTPAMERRLHEYKNILELSREALPLEDVPSGTLDGVLEQARSSAGASTTAATPTAASTGMWERLRRTFLVPALALAGSAALVLWWVRPRTEEARSADQVASVSEAREDARARAPEPFPATAAEAEAEPKREQAEVLAEEQAAAEGDAELTRDDANKLADEPADRLGGAVPGAPAQPASTPSPTTTKRGKKKSKKASGKGDFGPPYEPAKDMPAPKKPASKSPPPPSGGAAGKETSGNLWDDVNRGDRYRRGGDCKRARTTYGRVLSKKLPADVLARAHAGIGLCDDAQGRSSQAASRFRQARQLWPKVDAFISSELGKTYGGGGNAKKSKSRPKAEPQAAEQADEGKP